MTFKELRLAIGLTQEKMAQEMNVTWKSVARAEKGDPIGGKVAKAYADVAAKHGINEYVPYCPCCGRPL